MHVMELDSAAGDLALQFSYELINLLYSIFYLVFIFEDSLVD